jgi:glycosyltransferase
MIISPIRIDRAHCLLDFANKRTAMTRRLAIILPSFKDVRIGQAIDSIRAFDDARTVRIIVIDGGSPQDVLDIIAPKLEPDDILVSEPDRGIFDALNKGLDRSSLDYVGWLGSDDLFTGQLKSSEVLAQLENHDLLVGNLALIGGNQVRRITHSKPSIWGLAKYGLHNPHYATFGRRELLTSDRFDADHAGSDIEYFIKIFSRSPRVAASSRLVTLQREGGFSTRSLRRVADTNLALFHVYRRHVGFSGAALALTLKLGYKALGVGFFKLFPRRADAELRGELASFSL